jgi:hypothetical protein
LLGRRRLDLSGRLRCQHYRPIEGNQKKGNKKPNCRLTGSWPHEALLPAISQPGPNHPNPYNCVSNGLTIRALVYSPGMPPIRTNLNPQALPARLTPIPPIQRADFAVTMGT